MRLFAPSRPRAALRPIGWIVVAALFVGGGGCAYFNTFYFAKKHFREAERLRLATESEKLPPEAAKRYDDAIEQSRKVITQHPNSRWVDDAMFLEGASYLGKREYERAVETFEDLLDRHPDSDFVPRAHHMLGLAHFGRRNWEQMDVEFDRAVAADPEFEEIDEILFTRARAAESRRDLDGAIRQYRELVGRQEYGPRSDEALLRIGDLYFDAGRFDSAYASYDRLVDMTREDESYQEGRLKSAEALVRLGRSSEAIELLEPLLPRDEKQKRTGSEFPPRVRLQMARAWNALDQPERALEALRGVTELYGSSSYATEAQFQIGYTFEVFLDSLESAKTAYEEATRQATRSVFREQAQARLDNLRRLQELSTEAEGGDVDAEQKALASLRIAELYLFSQDRPTDARAAYAQILIDHPETKVAPRAAYGLGWIDLKTEPARPDSAALRFRRLIERWPASSQAHAALDLLVEAGADTTGLTSLLEETIPEAPPTDSTAILQAVAVDSSGLDVALDSLDSLGVAVDAPSDSGVNAAVSRRSGVSPLQRSRPPDARTDSIRAARVDSVRKLMAFPGWRDSIPVRARRDSLRRAMADSARRVVPDSIPRRLEP